jgi:hypothetical protein
LGLDREALAALRVFFHATAQAATMVELGRRLLGFLERARYDTALRFDPDPAGAVEESSRERSLGSE